MAGNETDPKHELLCLVEAFKNYVSLSADFDKEFGNLYIKGESSSCDVSKERESKDGPIYADRTALTLEDIRKEMGDCQRCGLHETRHHIVFGEGNPKADLVFVGEAPGQNEDLQGRPFVGRAGQLLTKIIEAMGLKRKDVYICNILKCRPPGNRNPKPDEIKVCEPFLIKQLSSIGPKVICALGTFAAHTLLKNDVPISLLRGKFHSYHDIKLMPTYHPAYLLRNPEAKKKVWEDVQIIMKELC